MFWKGFILLATTATVSFGQTPARPPYFGNVSWSPDSKTVLFESNLEGKYAIYRVQLADTMAVRLTPAASNSQQASWSPDGKQIVFSSDRDGHQQLYVMTPDGREVRRLTHTDSTQDFYATYSPNGQYIVFAVQPRPRWADYAVAVIRADGTARRAVTDSTRTSEGPRWAAKGERITFTQGPALLKRFDEATREEVRGRQPSMRSVSVRVDGTDMQPATSEPEELPGGIVSPDKKWRAIARTTAGSEGVYLVDVATGKERQLGYRPER